MTLNSFGSFVTVRGGVGSDKKIEWLQRLLIHFETRDKNDSFLRWCIKELESKLVIAELASVRMCPHRERTSA